MAGVPVYSLYGEAANRSSRPFAIPTAAPAPPGGGEYVGHTRCMANEATCQGAKAQGTDYCIGHLRSLAKELAVEPG